MIAAAIAAIDLIESDPVYAAEPLRKARNFARATNLPEPQSAIVPVILGETDAVLAASQLLEERRLSGRGDQAADGAARHGPPALCVHRATSGYGN